MIRNRYFQAFLYNRTTSCYVSPYLLLDMMFALANTSLRNKRFRLVSEQRTTEERDFWCKSMKREPKREPPPPRLLAPFFAFILHDFFFSIKLEISCSSRICHQVKKSKIRSSNMYSRYSVYSET